MMTFHPSLRFSVGAYVRPLQLDNVLHMVKPTVTISPEDSLYLHWTVLPHKHLSRTQAELTLEFQKQLSFGTVSLTLYAKKFNTQQSENSVVTGTQQLRSQVSVPIRSRRCVDFYCSKGSIFTSATLFEKKGEVHFFQGIDPRPVPSPESLATPVISPI